MPAPCPSSCFYPPPRAFTVDASLGAHAARIATTARVKQQGPALHTRFSHPSRPLFRCPGRRTLLVERVPVSWQMARLLRSDYVQTGTSATDCVVQVNSDQFQFQFVYSQPIRIDFWTTLTGGLVHTSSRMATFRRPDSDQTRPRFVPSFLSGGCVAVDYRPPLVPAILSTSGRIHSELHSRALHLAPHPRRHPDCDSDYLIRSLLQTFSRTLVTPTTAITPSGSVAANSSRTFAPFARQQLHVSGLRSVSW